MYFIVHAAFVRIKLMMMMIVNLLLTISDAIAKTLQWYCPVRLEARHGRLRVDLAVS